MFASDSDFEIDEELVDNLLSGVSQKCMLPLEQSPLLRSESILINNITLSPCISSYFDSSSNSLRTQEGCESTSRRENESNSPEVQQPTKSSIENSGLQPNRRFPGPAGILPDIGNFVEDTSIVSPYKSDFSAENKEKTCESMLESNTWKKLLLDLKKFSPTGELLKNINLLSVKEKASAGLLVAKKIPFLAVILQDISSLFSDPYLTLCDETGIMNGTLHRDVWKQHADDLFPASVLLLRNVSVLSIGGKAHKNHQYLNITQNNLVSIYSLHEDDVRVTNLKSFTQEEIIKSVKIWDTIKNLSELDDNNIEESFVQLFSSPTSRNSGTLNKSFFMTKLPNQLSPQISSASNKLIEFSNSTVTSAKQHSKNSIKSVANASCQSNSNIRNSSSILNLISNQDISSDQYKSSPYRNNSDVLITLNNNIESVNNQIHKNDSLRFVDNPEHNYLNSLKSNNYTNKLSKFSFNSKNIELHKNYENNNKNLSCNLNLGLIDSNDIVMDLKTKSSGVKIGKHSNANKSPLNFKPKKPCYEAFVNHNDNCKSINSTNDGNKDNFAITLLSDETDINVSEENILCSSSFDRGYEVSQVETVLEGLDASSFMDDFF